LAGRGLKGRKIGAYCSATATRCERIRCCSELTQKRKSGGKEKGARGKEKRDGGNHSFK